MVTILLMMMKISGKCAHFAENFYFYQKLPISKVESVSKSNFWPKSNMQNSAYTKPFGILTQQTFSIFLLKFIEMLWSYKKCQKIGVGRGLGQVMIKSLLAQTVWKFSLCSLHFQLWFKFQGNVLILLKNFPSIKKLPIRKVEGVLKWNFRPKLNRQNSPYTKLLS